MQPILRARLLSALLPVLVVPALGAQAPSPYATAVAAYRPGKGVGPGFADPRRALGAPAGAGPTMGSTDVVSLGLGGSLTLSFDAPLADGVGADFLVFENPFYRGTTLESFAEVFFVEVSSNGADFARFPVSYAGPSGPIGPFGTLVPGSWKGLGGTTPVFANPRRVPSIDPRDPARAGGDAFDLAALRGDPLVKAGKVNLFRITSVRFVDVEDGKHRDAKGRWIRDPSFGSADIDAVAVLHFLTTRSPRAPQASLSLTAARRIRLVLRDPDGLRDLDPAKLHLSVQGLPLDFFAFAGLTRVVAGDDKGFVLETAFALPRAVPIKLSASATDRGGHLAGSTLVLH